jgi:hypothetical protein
MQYMIIETFTKGPAAVYERFRERGRMAPEGLEYVSSVVTEDGRTCYQLMQCADRALLDQWMSNWSDIVHFEVLPVISSSEAAARFGPA